MATRDYTIQQKDESGNYVDVMKITITEPAGVVYSNIEWDSRTGIVTARVNGSERTPIPYTGVALGKLKPGPFVATNIVKMEYNYWYY